MSWGARLLCLGDGALAAGVGRVELLDESVFEPLQLLVEFLVELLLRDGLYLGGVFLAFGGVRRINLWQ